MTCDLIQCSRLIAGIVSLKKTVISEKCKSGRVWRKNIVPQFCMHSHRKQSFHKTYFNLVTALHCPAGSSAGTRLKTFSGNMFTRRSFYRITVIYYNTIAGSLLRNRMECIQLTKHQATARTCIKQQHLKFNRNVPSHVNLVKKYL